MTVRDIISACQNGTYVEIQLTEFFLGDDGDRMSIVFEGEVGHLTKCKYFDFDVDLIRVYSNRLLIDIHSFP